MLKMFKRNENNFVHPESANHKEDSNRSRLEIGNLCSRNNLPRKDTEYHWNLCNRSQNTEIGN